MARPRRHQSPVAGKDTLYTVKDVARIISPDPSPDGVAQMMRKVRHWTNSNVLVPVGDKATGTGISRTYSQNDVFKAAVIGELVRYGVTMDMLEVFDDLLEPVTRNGDWNAAIKNDAPHYLQFAWDDDSIQVNVINDDFYWREERLRLMGPERTSSIIVNLTAIYRRLRF